MLSADSMDLTGAGSLFCLALKISKRSMINSEIAVYIQNQPLHCISEDQANLLRSDVVFNSILDALPNLLRGDQGEVTICEDRINDCDIVGADLRKY